MDRRATPDGRGRGPWPASDSRSARARARSRTRYSDSNVSSPSTSASSASRRRAELDDLGLEPPALRVPWRRAVDLGVGELRRGDLVSASSRIWRALNVRLGHGLVGRALGEQQRAVEHVLGLADGPLLTLAELSLLGELAHALVEALDRRGGPFEQLVDLVAVVPAKPSADVDVTEFAGCHVHGVHGRTATARNVGTLADKSHARRMRHMAA